MSVLCLRVLIWKHLKSVSWHIQLQKCIGRCLHYRQSSRPVCCECQNARKAAKQYNSFLDHVCIRGRMRWMNHHHAESNYRVDRFTTNSAPNRRTTICISTTRASDASTHCCPPISGRLVFRTSTSADGDHADDMMHLSVISIYAASLRPMQLAADAMSLCQTRMSTSSSMSVRRLRIIQCGRQHLP